MKNETKTISLFIFDNLRSVSVKRKEDLFSLSYQFPFNTQDCL